MDEDGRVIEVTCFDVASGNAGAFAAAVGAVLPILARQPGAGGICFGPVVEPGNGYMLLVAWRRLADHEAFRAGADFAAFVGGFRPLLVAPARVLHLRCAGGSPA